MTMELHCVVYAPSQLNVRMRPFEVFTAEVFYLFNFYVNLLLFAGGVEKAG